MVQTSFIKNIIFNSWPCLKTANCETEYTTIPRANHDQLLQIFNKYATVEKSGKKYMNENDFVRK